MASVDLLVFLFSLCLCFLHSYGEEQSLSSFLSHISSTSPSSCAATFRLEREILNNGFHRELLSVLRPLPGQEKQVPENLSAGRCTLLLVQDLSPSFYVDVFQLQEIERFSRGPDKHTVRVIGDSDVERPSYSANSSTLLILKEQLPGQSDVSLRVPVHVRYQLPGDEEYTKLIIEPPRVYFSCDSPPVSYTSNHHWQRGCIDPTSNLPLSLQIPVGQRRHEVFVTIGTIAVTVLGAYIVTRAVWKAQEKQKALKRSGTGLGGSDSARAALKKDAVTSSPSVERSPRRSTRNKI